MIPRTTRWARVLTALSLLFATARIAAGGLPSAESATPASIDPDSTRAAVEDADEAFNEAARQRDREALGGWLAPDVIFLESEMLRGRPAFLERMQPMFEGKYDLTLDARNLETHVARSGEFAWTIGSAKTSFTRPGLTEETFEGHYLSVWVPDGEGEWKIQAYAPLIVHPELGMAREPRSGLMTAWPEIRDQIGAAIRLEWSPERTVRAGSAEMAYTFGEYSVVFSLEGEEKSGKGGFVAVWVTDEEDRWQLAAEGYSPPRIH